MIDLFASVKNCVSTGHVPLDVMAKVASLDAYDDQMLAYLLESRALISARHNLLDSLEAVTTTRHVSLNLDLLNTASEGLELLETAIGKAVALGCKAPGLIFPATYKVALSVLRMQKPRALTTRTALTLVTVQVASLGSSPLPNTIRTQVPDLPLDGQNKQVIVLGPGTTATNGEPRSWYTLFAACRWTRAVRQLAAPKVTPFDLGRPNQEVNAALADGVEDWEAAYSYGGR